MRTVRALCTTLAVTFLLSAVPAWADRAPSTCVPIRSLPFRIERPGHYCLLGSLQTTLSTGAAIQIDSDSVTLDLGGFAISGSDRNARGIEAIDRRYVTVRHGVVRGFAAGVALEGTRSGWNLVEDLSAEQNHIVGVSVEGTGNVVRRNEINITGAPSLSQAAIGIRVHGPMARILSNGLIQAGATEMAGHAILIEEADASVVEGNRIVNCRPALGTVGIKVSSGTDLVVTGNAIVGSESGLTAPEGAVSGRDNTRWAVGSGCTAAGTRDAGEEVLR
jgi:hypothetical protein